MQERQVTCRFGAADPGRSFASGNAPAKLLPWSGRYLEYREFGGFRVPSYVEVSWQLPEREFSYARFRVTKMRYNVGLPNWVPHSRSS